MKKKNPTRAVAFVLIVVVLLPAILYSGFEITALSTQENLIADTYRRKAVKVVMGGIHPTVLPDEVRASSDLRALSCAGAVGGPVPPAA